MVDRHTEDEFFEDLAARIPLGEDVRIPGSLKDRIFSALIDGLDEQEFREQLITEVPDIAAPARLKSRIYSALVMAQAQSGPLLSLSECETGGRALCVFEKLVEIAPVGQSIESINYCRICHARVVAERFENAPIYWPGCPYAGFQNH